MRATKFIPYSVISFSLIAFLLLAGKSKNDAKKFKSEEIVYEGLENYHNRAVTRLTYTENMDELNLSASPDGLQIAYEGWTAADKMGLFLIANKSADIKSVVHVDGSINRFPNWDITGTQIFFIPMKQYNATLTSKIVSIHKNGIGSLNLTPIHSTSEITSLSSSSQGHLVYSQKTNGVNKINLLNTKENYRVELTDGSDVSCSQDAKQIAFIRALEETSQLFIMEMNGANQQEIPTGLNLVKSPSFSPDGKWIAFCGQNTVVSDKKSTVNWDVFILEIGTQKIFQLTSDPADDVNPIWSNDNLIYFSSSRFGNFEIMKVNPGVK